MKILYLPPMPPIPELTYEGIFACSKCKTRVQLCLTDIEVATFGGRLSYKCPLCKKSVYMFNSDHDDIRSEPQLKRSVNMKISKYNQDRILYNRFFYAHRKKQMERMLELALIFCPRYLTVYVLMKVCDLECEDGRLFAKEHKIVKCLQKVVDSKHKIECTTEGNEKQPK